MLNVLSVFLFTFATLVVFCTAQGGRENLSPEERALYDMNVGMAGMKEAGKFRLL